MRASTFERGHRWLAAAGSLAVGLSFFALWFGCYRDGWVHVEMAGAARWRWLAAIPSVLGFAVRPTLRLDFGWTGRGTPAHRRRNDWWRPVLSTRTQSMYVGFRAGWIGLWIIFGHPIQN